MAADTILKENADTFLEHRNLLTAKQWDFLAFPRIFAESPY